MLRKTFLDDWAGSPLSAELGLANYPPELRKKLWYIWWDSQGDVTPTDLLHDIWLLNREFIEEHSRDFNPHDEADQKFLLRRLNKAYMKTSDRKQRYAVRIDREIETEDGSYSLGERLELAESPDPLAVLEQKESAMESLRAFRESYSEAAAYFVSLAQFDNHRQRLRAYLAIAAATLIRRVASAIHCIKHQPSLFDRIEYIPEDFMPREGRALAAVVRISTPANQAVLVFDVSPGAGDHAPVWVKLKS